MDAPKSRKITPQLRVMEMTGMLLAGLGLAEALAKTNLVPTAIQFANYDWAMVIVGYAMTVPGIVRRIRSARADKSV